MFVRLLTLAVLGGVLSIQTAASQESKSYPDGRGNDITFPLGDLSFADEVVSFLPGSPPPPPEQEDPIEALGIPDYGTDQHNELTLGCGGTAIFRFTDNALVDVTGPDLFVFEVGPDVEATTLSISGDGDTWIDVGRISGATAAIDIAAFITPGETFSFVQLTDARESCSSRFPGADIDAVGAIGAGRRIVLDSAVLFDFDKFTLKEEALEILQPLAEEIGQNDIARIVIEGHTDAVGSDTYNQRLSEQRASAVRTFLAQQEDLSTEVIESVGYGESRPAALNDTAENRKKNRRVEILILVE